jgi:20S proteasome alpha/beta subunit
MNALILIFMTFLSTNASSYYEKAINRFSPEGRLLQVDYAETASQKGSPVVAVATADSRIIVITKTLRDDIFLDRRVMDKVEPVDDEMWITFCGLAGDCRALIRLARNQAADFRASLGFAPPPIAVAKMIAECQHESTLSGGAL